MMQTRTSHPASIGAVLALVAAGPAISSETQPGAPQDEPAEAAASQSQPDVVGAVKNALSDTEGLEEADISVRMDDGMVALDGTVDNILAHDRAIRVATSVEGVRAIDDNLVVTPAERPDSEIERDVETALALDPATEEWEIDALVRGGNVTLRGIVESFAEQSLAARVAKGVRGVRSITNSIEVDYGVPRKDSEIEKEVEALLKWNTTVDGKSIDVSVEDGIVTLSGTVSSLYERNQAERLSQVAGAKDVEVADLSVGGGGPSRAESRWAEPSDQEIAAALRMTLDLDPRVEDFDPGIAVENGIATLSGTVDNQMAKAAAAETARDTRGVTQVRNHITVEPEPVVPDETLEKQVTAAIQRDPYVSDSKVDIEAVDGIVYLYGDVDSIFEKREAGDAASRVAGVRQLHNELDVDLTSRAAAR